MPRRSKVTELPKAVREWLDSTLVEGNFSGYEVLETELKKRGHTISKSAIHRYGANLERRMAAIRASTEAAESIVKAAPDDSDSRSAAVMSLIQTDLFDVLLKLQEAEDCKDPAKYLKLLNGAAISVAQLANASVAQKKWQVELRSRVKDAAAEVAATVKKAGLDDDAVEQIRSRILGIGQ